MATTYLSRTASTNNNSVGKWTFSCWVKRNKITQTNESNLISFYNDSQYRSALRFDDDDKIRFYEFYNGSTIVAKITNQLFRDTSGWYHIVLAVDKTVASPDTQLYINGVATTSWSTDDDYTQDESGTFDDAETLEINAQNAGGIGDCVMSHVHFCDGTKYAASDFGETDATSGIWKIKTSPSVTYGTNGFTILKDGNTITDQSSNSNNFTLGAGTLTNTEDCPSNVFCTLNPLQGWQGQNRTPSQVLNKGNLTTGIGSSEKAFVCGSIGVRSGKYYWEAKSDGVSKLFFGVTNRTYLKSSTDPHSNSDYTGIYYYEGTPDFRTYGGQTSTTGIASISTNDILGFALDMDNYAFYIHKNGTYMNSGDPTSGSSKTGSIAALFTYGINVLRDYEEVFPAAYVTSTSGSGTASFNFGNGYFGTTAISSEGTNASGIGKFEYDVPTGYTALSTKGLNE